MVLNQSVNLNEMRLTAIKIIHHLTFCKPMKTQEIKKLKKGLYKRIKLCYIS